MTTIAYTAGCMAADTQMTRGTEKATGAVKIFATDHFLVGFSGSYGAVPALLDFVRQHEVTVKGDATKLHVFWDDLSSFSEAFSMILVNKDGTIFYGGDMPPVVVPRAFEAIGTGAKFATGSMAYGAGAKKAVRIAAELDAFTGGEIMFLTLKDIGEKK